MGRRQALRAWPRNALVGEAREGNSRRCRSATVTCRPMLANSSHLPQRGTTLRIASLVSLLAGTAVAQATGVGLTMIGGVPAAMHGQMCGPVNCFPLPGGAVAPGQGCSLTIFAQPNSLCAVAIGLPGQFCLPTPGIDNFLTLDINSLVVLHTGLTGSQLLVQCSQPLGIASASFTLPPSAPIGVVFRVQSFGQVLGGGFAFGPTIQATVQ